MLGVPRPTLYRYLKEYPIPYARRSGRIRIPDDSLEGIRKARALHDDGLGTEAVRRRLLGEESSLEERLDDISETLEQLRREGTGVGTEALVLAPGDVRTILARQTLLISAVFEMSRMLEELLASTGRPRQSTFEDALQQDSAETSNGRHELAPAAAVRHLGPADPAPYPRGTFGSLTQRRRRLAIAGLLLLLVAVPALFVGAHLL